MPDAENERSVISIPGSTKPPEECQKCGHSKEMLKVEEGIEEGDPKGKVFTGPSMATEGGDPYLKYSCARCGHPVFMDTKDAAVRSEAKASIFPADPEKAKGNQPKDKGRAGHVDTRKIGDNVRDMSEDAP